MVDPETVRALQYKMETLQRDFEALRTRTTRILITAGILVAGAGIATCSAIDNVENVANTAEMNALNGLNQAAMATSKAYQAANDAQYVRLQVGAGNGRPLPVMPKFQPVVRSGTVTEVTGTAPASVDETCTVTVISRNGGNDLNCQVSVRCGGNTIYGGGTVGYLVCGIENEQPTLGRDTETQGDPMLDLNLAGNTVVVSDGPSPEYSVTIALDVPDAP